MRLLPASLGHRASIGIVVAVLAVGATVGAFASQDVLTGTSDDTVATQTDDGVTYEGTVLEDETDGDTDDTDGDTETEIEDGDEDAPREIVGIPDENPNFEPENGDGTCNKGETVVKTTPSGKQVNVPCHSVEVGPPSFSKGQKGGDAPTEDGDDVEDEEEEEVE
jgi:hypothetical protein